MKPKTWLQSFSSPYQQSFSNLFRLIKPFQIELVKKVSVNFLRQLMHNISVPTTAQSQMLLLKNKIDYIMNIHLSKRDTKALFEFLLLHSVWWCGIVSRVVIARNIFSERRKGRKWFVLFQFWCAHWNLPNKLRAVSLALPQTCAEKKRNSNNIIFSRAMRKIFKYSALWFTRLSWRHSTWRAKLDFSLRGKDLKKFKRLFLCSLKYFLCSFFSLLSVSEQIFLWCLMWNWVSF